MPAIRNALLAVLITTATTPAMAGDLSDGWDWLAGTSQVETQGAVWNDRFGDGKDRWKTGGITQSYVLPEGVFSDDAWFDGRASALEVNMRALVITPDDTSYRGVNGNDRPYAQYAGAGLYLRSIARPDNVTPDLALQTDGRVGIEIGWQGDPLPLFEVRDAVHGMSGTAGNSGQPTNTIDGEILANIEARHTWRLHMAGTARDVELAPFVQTSLGMRENSLRAGGDIFIGSALEGRTWGNDLSTGAVVAGASKPRPGFNWTVFLGGDVGYVASDAFLDGGFSAHGPEMDRRDIVARARAGILLDYGRFGVGFSLNWLGREFEAQPEGQLIGAVQLKYRF